MVSSTGLSWTINPDPTLKSRGVCSIRLLGWDHSQLPAADCPIHLDGTQGVLQKAGLPGVTVVPLAVEAVARLRIGVSLMDRCHVVLTRLLSPGGSIVDPRAKDMASCGVRADAKYRPINFDQRLGCLNPSRLPIVNVYSHENLQVPSRA